MIRWEETDEGNWLGFSGQVQIAAVTNVSEGQWNWEVTGAGKIKGVRNAGHRTDELDARRAVETLWQRWLQATALKPDLINLAETSLRKAPKRVAKEERPERAEAPKRDDTALKEALRKADAAEQRAESANERAKEAEERAAAAEARLAEAERSAKARIEKLRQALSE